VRFHYRNPNVTYVLGGSRNAANVHSNLEMLELGFDEALIEQAVELA
jgi:hypothetical protein